LSKCFVPACFRRYLGQAGFKKSYGNPLLTKICPFLASPALDLGISNVLNLENHFAGLQRFISNLHELKTNLQSSSAAMFPTNQVCKNSDQGCFHLMQSCKAFFQVCFGVLQICKDFLQTCKDPFQVCAIQHSTFNLKNA
jgi:hypothetical protein